MNNRFARVGMKRSVSLFVAMAFIITASLFAPTAAFDEDKIVVLDDFEGYRDIDDVMKSHYFVIGDNVEPDIGLEQIEKYEGDRGNWVVQLGASRLTTGTVNNISVDMNINQPLKNISDKFTEEVYVQFWAYNPSNQGVELRFRLMAGSQGHAPLATLIPVDYEWKPGSGKFVSTRANNTHVMIPPGHKGLVRIPAAVFGSAVDGRELTGLRVLMYPPVDRDVMVYVDDFAFTTDDYTNPKKAKTPDDFFDISATTNHQNGSVIAEGKTSSGPGKVMAIEIIDPSGEIIHTASIETNELIRFKYNSNPRLNHYQDMTMDYKAAGFSYEYQIPSTAPDGEYKIRFSGAGVEQAKEFPYIRDTYMTQSKKLPKDVLGTSWEQAVEKMISLGVLKGYEDGSFKPEGSISRAELAAVLARTLRVGKDDIISIPFTDVAPDHWAAEDIAAASSLGVIIGNIDGSFSPEEPVTLEQAVKMLVSALGYEIDAEQKGGYPDGYMLVADELGLTDFEVEPEKSAGRGMVSQLISNALNIPLKDGGEVTTNTIINHQMTEVMDEVRLNTVLEFADNVLKYGRDVYGEEKSPLFADGFNTQKFKPVEWVLDSVVHIPSNLANQQNLLRTLTGLTNLTGEQTYKEVAKEQFKYHFDHLVSDCGLLKWGPHAFIDLIDIPASIDKLFFSSWQIHEFKYNLPFYELMWEVDPEATEKFINAFWNAHIVDWNNLSINRHASYNDPMGELWDSVYINDLEGKVGYERIFAEDGLSFLNVGTDLVYAGTMISQLGGDHRAQEWAKRLANLYVSARHPQTKLGTSQFSQVRQTRFDLPDSNANSAGGDRAKRQFGPEFGDYALEAYIMFGTVQTVLQNGLCQIHIYESTGQKEFLDWTLEGMRAFAKYQYNAETDMVRPMLADGTDLTGYVLPRDGYYGNIGKELKESKVDITALLTFARAYRITKASDLWDTIRAMAKHRNLGDLGEQPGKNMDINYMSKSSDPIILYALIDIYRATGEEAYLKLARVVGNNIVEDRYNGGFFLQKGRANAKFDAIEPLALLTLEGAIRGDYESVPSYIGSKGFIDANHDGYGRITDDAILYNK